MLPRDWIRPLGVGVYTNNNGTNTLSWQAAPRVAFPSYSFSVQNGAGLSLAVPIQGVPVGLSLLASDAASGSIQIQDARTMGVDTISLYQQLQGWAKTNRVFLGNYGTSTNGQRTNYVRVITRVFASGRMIVSLKDASNRSGGLDAGVPKPVNLLQPQLPSDLSSTPEAALSNYTNAWNAISQMVKAAGTAVDAAGQVLPGGSLRLAAASARSVSLDETFDPPVILGYLGFDCVINEGGNLGPPMPTYANLHATVTRDSAPFCQWALGPNPPRLGQQSQTGRHSRRQNRAGCDQGSGSQAHRLDSKRRAANTALPIFSTGLTWNGNDRNSSRKRERNTK